VSLGLGETN
jgi:hypothetical protein